MIRPPDQTVELAALAAAEPDAGLLAEVVSAALRDGAAEVRTAVARSTGYAHSSIATGGLFRVTGTAVTSTGTRPWSVFVKVLHHPRHWHLIDLVPPAAAEEIRRLFPWREELETREQVLPVLPDGLRVPEIYRVADLGDDRLAVWMEDIDVDDDPWSDATYARAAFLLARLAARRLPGTAAGASDLPPGLGVRKVVESRAPMLAGVVADDAVWARSTVRDHVDTGLRADLSRALDRLPALLTEMATLPSSLPHGDAAPVNLLRPGARTAATSRSTGPSAASSRSVTTWASCSWGTPSAVGWTRRGCRGCWTTCWCRRTSTGSARRGSPSTRPPYDGVRCAARWDRARCSGRSRSSWSTSR
jgi:hypothetical protein